MSKKPFCIFHDPDNFPYQVIRANGARIDGCRYRQVAVNLASLLAVELDEPIGVVSLVAVAAPPDESVWVTEPALD